jgi:pantothenate synthetase
MTATERRALNRARAKLGLVRVDIWVSPHLFKKLKDLDESPDMPQADQARPSVRFDPRT